MEMKLLEKKYQDIEFEPTDYVGVKRFGNITEIRSLMPVHDIKIKMLSKEEKIELGLSEEKKYYVRLDNGEINECKVRDSRKDNFDSVRESITKIRDYINYNVRVNSKCKWVTLTYAQRKDLTEEAKPMRDTKKLYLDFKHFISRLREHYSNQTIEYIAVPEPQRSGSWHMHVILIFSRCAPFISNEDLREKFWRKGFVKINGITGSCDNIGVYFSAYLCNVEYENGMKLEDNDEIISCQDAEGNIKKYVKGGRLKFYPANFNMYRISSGIQAVVEEQLYFYELDVEELGTLTYQKETVLYDSDTNQFLIHKMLQFHKNRSQKKMEELKNRLSRFKVS